MWKKLFIFTRHIFGYKYVLNISTGEVHLENSVGNQCGISYMNSKNKKYLTKRQYLDIVNTYYNNKWVNGCTHCNKITDNE